MSDALSADDRVSVPFNIKGITEDAIGTVIEVRSLGSKTVVKIRLDEHDQAVVDYPLEAVSRIGT
jgi:hypothetical protein